MKRIAAIALFAIATLMTAGSASAQSAVLKVDVPFNFTVSGTSVPAGSYTFGFDLKYPDILVVQDRTNSIRARALVQRGSIGPGKPGTLILHRYGGQYFLSEVRFGSASNGAFLAASKLERQARKVSRNEEMASIAGH
ncbi:MAG: hypothetical protein ABSD61_04905 [Terracidiphilus sp.]|jgi:hypothetical protein